MNNLFATILLFLFLVHCGAADDFAGDPRWRPISYIGAEAVWNNGSIRVLMTGASGKVLRITLRGKGVSVEDPESLIVIVDGLPIDRDSRIVIGIVTSLYEIRKNIEHESWKGDKIEFLIGLLEGTKFVSGLDVRELLRGQPFEEVHRNLQAAERSDL